jgi:imidazolonepropionase-like amidohydrolase
LLIFISGEKWECSPLSGSGDLPPPSARPQGRYDIAGVTVINPLRERPQGATIEIRDGSIASISERPAARQSEFAGLFALPGLVDMHVHLPPDNALKLTSGACLLYLAHGITTLHEAGDLDGTAVDAARRLAREGAHPVPRVYCCGPFVGAGEARFKNTLLLPDASTAAAEDAALRVKAAGATFMKFYEGLTEPMIRALERACARHNLKIMATSRLNSPTKRRALPKCSIFSGCHIPRPWSAIHCSTAPQTGTRSTSGGWTTSSGSA